MRIPLESKQSPQRRRISKRVVKAKRKLDFIYESDKDSKDSSGTNNNAQIVTDDKRLVNLVRHDKSANLDRHDKLKLSRGVKGVCKGGAMTKVNPKSGKHNVNKLFDGIQVSVNSDEELDYEDDVQEEESGSIDEDYNRGRSSDEANDSTTLPVNDSRRRQSNPRFTPPQTANSAELNLGASSASMADKDMVMNTLT